MICLNIVNMIRSVNYTENIIVLKKGYNDLDIIFKHYYQTIEICNLKKQTIKLYY